MLYFVGKTVTPRRIPRKQKPGRRRISVLHVNYTQNRRPQWNQRSRNWTARTVSRKTEPARRAARNHVSGRPVIRTCPAYGHYSSGLRCG